MAERTDEERQRAREERERRRGVKQPAPIAAEPAPGEPVPGEAPSDAVEHSMQPPPAEPPSVQPPPAEPSLQEPPPAESLAEGLPPAEPFPQEPPSTEPLSVQPPAVEPLSWEPPAAPLVEPPAPAGSRRDPRVQKRVDRLRARRASSHRWQRRWGMRLVVLLALAGVAVVVWLLVRSPSDPPKPPPPPRVVKVVIPEGYTRAQIAALAKADGLTGSYLSASVRSPLLQPTRYGAPSGTPNLEGFLFPATYDMYTGTPAKRLVNEQLQAFTENFGAAETHRAHALGLTPYELLTVASMIEREAQVEHDRPLIAAVIYNRLRLHMPLGIDATIRYALNDFSEPLTEAQLHSPSPYNTRLHTGLPPTPIANPGLASIHAAAHPAHVGYLYYVAGADGCGEQVFSSTFAEFEHNAAAYREAVAKNHGRVPTCHKK